MIVLDEADRMCDMGFEKELREVMNTIRADK
jgi:superfamily II DNA/RNA helicase